MKKSVMTAGEIYESVYKLRAEINELKEALNAVFETMGENNGAYKLLQKQKDDKFLELQDFENTPFSAQHYNRVLG